MKQDQIYRPVLSPLLLVASGIIIVAGVMAAQSIILPILLALFISVISAQPITWLEKKKIPHVLSVVIVLSAMLLVMFLLGGVIGRSLANFSNDLPKYEDNLVNMMTGLTSKLNGLGVDISTDHFSKVLDPGKILGFTAGIVGQLGSILSDSFMILLIAIFMLMELKDFAYKADVIEKTQSRSLDYLTRIGESIRQYLSIKTAVSLLTGVFIFVWLWIVGVDYPVLWGIIAFLLNYIPNIGSILAAVPTMLLALVQLGPVAVFWTATGYVVVNMVVGNVIEPKVMGKGLGLSTLVVFLSLIFWGYVFGSVGMFLSVPLTMTIKIMLEKDEKTKWMAMLLGTTDEIGKPNTGAEKA